MDNLNAIEHLINRGLVPPAFKAMLGHINLTDVADRDLREVREVAALAEGQGFINRVMAAMVGMSRAFGDADLLPVDETARDDDDEQGADPFDQDGDGKAGGSLPAIERAAIQAMGMTVDSWLTLSEAKREGVIAEGLKLTGGHDDPPPAEQPEQPKTEGQQDAPAVPAPPAADPPAPITPPAPKRVVSKRKGKTKPASKPKAARPKSTPA